MKERSTADDAGARAHAELVQRVGALQLHARRLASGVLAGLHRSVHRGGSAEFAEYKEYAPGDDPRTIDWKSVARTDRWFVKRYEETTNRRTVLMLDASASMGFTRGGRPSKLETARLLLAALSALLLGQGDAVGLAVLRDGDEAESVPPRARGGHLEAVLAGLARAEPRGRTLLSGSLDVASAHLPRRSLVVLASDLVDDAVTGGGALRRLRAGGHEIIVFQVLDTDELAFPFIGTLRFRDPETGDEVTTEAASVAPGYRRELEAFLAAWDREVAGAGGDVVSVTNADDLGTVLLRFLSRRRHLARRLVAAG